MANIPKHLIEKIRDIPAKPGIYQMKDSYGNIIYIGKSKTLKSRVRSYFSTQHEWNKIKRMVFHIHDINIILTDTHLEAQLLECALIKKIKPLYNSQFKNDKKYCYLKIEESNSHMPLAIVHEKEDEFCFGPYRNKNALLGLIDFFKKSYPILKSIGEYQFTYKILPHPLELKEFERNRNNLMEIFTLKDSMETFLKTLEKKMNLAAADYQFETASIYRDIGNYIKYLYENNMHKQDDLSPKRVLMGEAIENGYKLFYVLNGNLILKKKFERITEEEIDQFILLGKTMETKAPQKKSEKSQLDFKAIINIEMQEDSKAILDFGDSPTISEVNFFVKKLNR